MEGSKWGRVAAWIAVAGLGIAMIGLTPEGFVVLGLLIQRGHLVTAGFIAFVGGVLGTVLSLTPAADWPLSEIPRRIRESLSTVRSYLAVLPRMRVRSPVYFRNVSPELDPAPAPTPDILNRFREIVRCCRGPMDGTANVLRKTCEELREDEDGAESLVAWLLTYDRGIIRRYQEISARLNNAMPPPGRDVSQEEFRKLRELFVDCHRHHYDLAQAHRKVMESLEGPEYFWLDDEYDSLRRAHLRCRDKLHDAQSHSELSGLLGAIHHQVGFVWNLFPRRNHSHQQELQALYDEGQRIREQWPSPEDDFEVQNEYAEWVARVAGFLDDNLGHGSVPAFGGRFAERKVVTLNANELRERLDDRMRRLETIIQRLSTR